MGLALAGAIFAGVATAVKALSPRTSVLGVEPADFDDTRMTLG